MKNEVLLDKIITLAQECEVLRVRKNEAESELYQVKKELQNFKSWCVAEDIKLPDFDKLKPNEWRLGD